MPYCFKEEGRLEQKWKRPLALLLSVAMMFSMSGTPVYAADMETGASAVCPHHVHDETCGYSEGTPCTHEHTDDCYTLVTQCVHEHTAECYSDGILPVEGGEKAADACTHVCSEESGCITKELNCPHVHDETCGYSEGSPCTFDPSDCELCNPTDSGEPEAPAECTCETLCTADSVNPDCPVCGAEGADLAACAGTVEEGDAAEETDPAQNPAEQTILSWEWIGADNLNEGVLPLPGVSAENPVDLDAVVSMLPTGITATVDGSADSVELALTWSCEGFPETASGGEYTFTAELPEGYALGKEAAALTVPVVLGGAQTLAAPSGIGTQEDPYRIYRAAELLWFAQAVNDGQTGACAILCDNIDLSGIEKWTPIGTSSKPYAGTFNGTSFSISNMTIENAGSYSGLFGYVTGTVMNLSISGSITVNGQGQHIGGAVGCLDGSGKVSNVTSTVKLNVTGTAEHTTAVSRIGGVVGAALEVHEPTVEECIFAGEITFTNDVDCLGGIIGYIWSGNIKNCGNVGTITGNAGSSAGNYCVGGILGYCNNNDILLWHCFNGVAVQAEGVQYVGGIVGQNKSHQAGLQWCFYIDEMCQGNGNDNKGEKVTAEQLASGYVTYMLNEKNSGNIRWAWYQTLGLDPYPTLDDTHERVYLVDGTYSNTSDHAHVYSADGFCTNCGNYQMAPLENDVYQISNAGQLLWFAALVNDDRTHAVFLTRDTSANAKLTKDITIPDGHSWAPIGNYQEYSGTFDGAGHTIHGMVVNSSKNQAMGFVGYLDTEGVIKNLALGKDCSVTGSVVYVGGLCGRNEGSISNCCNGATVTGENGNTYVGGICGQNMGGRITNCYNTGDITGDIIVGGVCGSSYNDGIITNCYWLDTSASTGVSGDSSEVTKKTAQQFASGEVTYLLNGGNTQSPVWRQNVDQGTKDALPVLDSSHGVVYRWLYCDNKTACTYSNSERSGTIHGNYTADGFCACGEKYQPAAKNDSGVYQITNAGNLLWFAALVNGDQTHAEFDAQNTAASAVLTANITIPEGQTWTPIGTSSNPYTGTFDGAGNTIEGLKIEGGSAQYQGFVGYLGAGAIQNLTLGESCSVTGGKYSGGVCGWNDAGAITGCTNKGAVNGKGDLGGVCGHNLGTVENCTNSGKVTNSSAETVGGVCGYSHTSLTGCTNNGNVDGGSQRYVGGIVGYIDDGASSVAIRDCTNTGAVTGGDSTGGICGYGDVAITGCTNSGAVTGSGRDTGGICGSAQKGSAIQNCTNTGTVTGGTQNTGGVCGYSDGVVAGCCNTGNVSTGKYVGGVCGYSDANASVTNCYNTGSLSAGEYTGGVCGGNGGAIANCHNAGATDYGVCGHNKSSDENSITNCYYLDTTCSSAIGGTGKGTATAKTDTAFASGEVTYLLNGSTSEGDLVWYQNLDNGKEKDNVPVLDSSHGVVFSGYGQYSNSLLHPYDNGFCTECGQYEPAEKNGSVYEISNAGQLFWFAALVNGDKTHAEFDQQNTGAKAVLTSDITIPAGYNWTPIGNSSNNYTGTFDGQGHTIGGLKIDGGDSYQGFVGYLKEGTIQNLTLGPTCSVTGDAYTGGLCGYNNRGYIRNCVNNGAVNGGLAYIGGTGGICGQSNSRITNCYNTGAVNGRGDLGGICGGSNGTITNCYWLDATCDKGVGAGSGGVTAKTAEEFASGEVAYLLNGSRSNSPVWYQNLNNGQPVDAYPVLDASHGTVYKQSWHCGGLTKEYTNDMDFQGQDEHSFDESGICTNCGAYQPAEAQNGVYQIKNVGNLFWFAALVNGDTNQEGITQAVPNANAVLTADIDLGGREWAPIAPSTTFKNNATTVEDTTNKSYSGTFDGQGHTISNFEIRTNRAELTSGLFGAVTGTIENLGVVNARFDNGGAYDGRFGALCGLLVKDSSTQTAATIQNCYVVNSSIEATGKIAGAVCGANYGGTIANCYEYGNTVTAHERIGHLVGDNQNDASTGTMIGTVTNCYSDTKVVGDTTSSKTGTVNGGGVKDAEEFASGEVAYLLNGSSSDSPVWFQNLDNGQDKDTYPVLDSSHGTVYRIEEESVRYSNSPNSEIISVDITWGELSFTYSDGTWNPDTHTYDGAGWNVDEEGGNSITVDNTGNTGVNVYYAYQNAETGITGSFTDGENPVSAPVFLPENGSSTVYLILADKPENELMEAIIGSVTVTIGGESE